MKRVKTPNIKLATNETCCLNYNQNTFQFQVLKGKIVVAIVSYNILHAIEQFLNPDTI
jgi:hypothetical protein